MPWLYPKLWVDFEGYCGVSLCTPITSPRIPPKIGGILNPLVVVAKKRVFIKGYLTRKLSKLPMERFFSFSHKVYLTTSILIRRNKKKYEKCLFRRYEDFQFFLLVTKNSNIAYLPNKRFSYFFYFFNLK